MDPVPAAISFFALGVVLFGAVAMILLAPRNREVRWFAAFSVSVMAWLLALGLGLLNLAPGTGPRIGLAGAALMPALFVAMAAASDVPRQRWHSWLAAWVGVVAVFVVEAANAGVALFGPAVRPMLLAIHVIGWTMGVVLLLRNERRRGRAPLRAGAVARSAVIAIAVLTPTVAVVAQLIGLDNVLVTIMPGLVVVTFIALFVGVARLRFYDIEIRAERSGALAAEAAETARMTALGEMAASFAHEVRNPLTGVRSLAQRIAEDDVDDARRRRYAGVILDEVARVERIVGDLLSVSRSSALARGRTMPTPLDSLFDDVVLLTSSRARRGKVHVNAAAKGLTANVSREALAQALLNLVLNAIAHSPAEGRVRITALPSTTGIAITVTDEGPGVPQDERERIFEPFYSARPDGTGLGLTVVRTLAREFGWTVAVRDIEGCGAAFELDVPRCLSTHTPAGGEA